MDLFITFSSTASSTYNAISTGSSNNVISALSFDIQGNSTGGELRSQTIGTAPNRTFVVQWSSFRAYNSTGDNYNFQIRLNETSNTIQIHYGAFTQNATNRTAEVGLRGSSSADYLNRRIVSGTHTWTSSANGGANTQTCELRTALIPDNGRRFTYTPSASGATYTSSTCTQVLIGNVKRCPSNFQIIRLEVVMSAGCPINLTQLVVGAAGSTNITSDVSSIKVYYTGNSTVFSTSNLMNIGGTAPAGATTTISGTVPLSSGSNYFWITYDINSTASLGNMIDASCTSITVNGSAQTPTTTSPAGNGTVIECVSPGGVATGLSHWIRSDIGVTGNPVTAWADNSAAQILGDLIPLGVGQSPTVQSGIINYQNHIRFDGTDDGLRSTNAVSAVPSGLYSNQNNTILMVKNIRAVGIDVDYKWEIDGGGTNRMGFELNGNAQRFDFANGFSGQNSLSTTNITNNNNIVGAITDPTNSIIRINGLANVTHNHSGSSLAGTGATARHLYIGSNDVTNYAYYCNVDIAEELTFNRTLSAAELLRVESYLGIKYSITLGNTTTPSNYTSSNSTVIWTGLSAYQNNIIGIGRDDLSSLNTKQSKQSDDRVRIYMSTLQTTNATNTSTFSIDRSFVVQGSNTGALCATTASNAEIPTGLTNCALYSRLEREWRVTRTNMAQAYNMDIRLDACAVPGSVNVSHLRLLVDNDGNFSNGGTQCYYNGDGSGIVISYSNPYITISGISTTHIPNNSTRFITIASVNGLTPLPIDLTYFNAIKNSENQVNLIWETSMERDSDYFLLEKSSDLEKWEFVSKVKAAGNSIETLIYESIDNNPFVGTNYYRLKQFDLNGDLSYNDIRTVYVEDVKLFTMYPNPAQNELKLYTTNFKNSSIQIVNNLGQIIWSNEEELTDSNIQIDLQHFSEGVYFVHFNQEGKQEVQKLVVKK